MSTSAIQTSVATSSSSSSSSNRKVIMVKLTIKSNNVPEVEPQHYTIPKVFMSSSPILKQLLRTKSARGAEYTVPAGLQSRLIFIILALLEQIDEDEYTRERPYSWTPSKVLPATVHTTTISSVNTSQHYQQQPNAGGNTNNSSNNNNNNTKNNKVLELFQRRPGLKTQLYHVEVPDLVPLYLLVEHFQMTLLSWIVSFRIFDELHRQQLTVDNIVQMLA
jgi:hypothetical protein